MIDTETDNNLKKIWDSMPHLEKLNLLSEYQFWEGFSVYRYEYIPDDLKDVLMLRIKEKGVNLA